MCHIDFVIISSRLALKSRTDGVTSGIIHLDGSRTIVDCRARTK